MKEDARMNVKKDILRATIRLTHLLTIIGLVSADRTLPASNNTGRIERILGFWEGNLRNVGVLVKKF